MAGATLNFDTDDADALDSAEQWIEVYRDRLTYVSDRRGGGSVLIYDIEGPDEVIATLPRLIQEADPKLPSPLPLREGPGEGWNTTDEAAANRPVPHG